MKTKVIVATYNGQTFKLLEKLVNSLNNVKSFGDYEILIVDNMSNDIEHNIYLESLNNKNISYIKNNTRGFDSGAYKYAIPQIINTADY